MSWLPRGECSGFNYNGAEQGLVLGVGKQPFEIEVDELNCNWHILSSPCGAFRVRFLYSCSL